jgi:pyrroline-5-carboxylate reductase
MTQRIAIIGCGNLGEAILNGLLDSELVAASQLTATRRNTQMLDHFNQRGVRITRDNALAISEADIVLLALKPHTILEIVADLKTSFDATRQTVVSLATGVSMESLQQALPEGIPLFRAMPNTAAFGNESLTCICTSSDDSERQELVCRLFESIGKIQLIEEKLMEAATVLGACGIAFVLRFMRAMVQGGIEIGFSSQVAGFIVNQTVNGAARLLIENGDHPEAEIDKVTTPKGCTIQGLNEMEHNGFSSALIKGIVTSFERIES